MKDKEVVAIIQAVKNDLLARIDALERSLIGRSASPAPAKVTKLLDVREAAEELGIAEKTLRAWIAFRQIDYVRVGRAIRIPRAAIEHTIASGTIPSRKER